MVDLGQFPVLPPAALPTSCRLPDGVSVARHVGVNELHILLLLPRAMARAQRERRGGSFGGRAGESREVDASGGRRWLLVGRL